MAFKTFDLRKTVCSSATQCIVLETDKTKWKEYLYTLKLVYHITKQECIDTSVEQHTLSYSTPESCNERE